MPSRCSGRRAARQGEGGDFDSRAPEYDSRACGWRWWREQGLGQNHAMIAFVDPRSNPEPPPQVSREPAAHGEELREFIGLCSAGRVYDAERWIQNRRPIQALTYKRPKKPVILSPLRAAIRDHNADLVLLLLCNGYRLDLEENDRGTVLDEALTVRAFEIMELLLKWGADPAKVNGQNVVDTYRSDLIDRFWRAGVDYTVDRDFPVYLTHTVNKPLYGWLRQNRSDQRLQDALDIALVEAVIEEKIKQVHLLLWAGADPHRKVPSVRDLGGPDAWDPEALSSAAETAIVFGRHELLRPLRVASMPDLETQIPHAHDSRILKELAALRPPLNWSEVILAFVRKFYTPPFLGLSSSWDDRDALRFIESHAGRLATAPPDELRYLRSTLLEVREDDFTWLLKWLKKEKNCEPAIYHELTRTPAMRQKIRALADGSRYLCPSVKMSRANERRRRAAERKRNRVEKPRP